jgi:5-formyltetrahydrofolate cyclo-ligase
MNAHPEKAELRRLVDRRLNGLSESDLNEASNSISISVRKLPVWSEARVVLTYLAFRHEVSTMPIIRAAWDAGKTVGIPRIDGPTLSFHVYAQPEGLGVDPEAANRRLIRHPYGMNEPIPQSRQILIPAKAESPPIIVVVPGVAFDSSGGRLGRGKGFYDRFLREHRACLCIIGVCTHAQVLPFVPVEPHDVRMDWIVTERAVYCGPDDTLDSNRERQ